jgi:thymidylate synthase
MMARRLEDGYRILKEAGMYYNFEEQYINLIRVILRQLTRRTRNGITRAVFAPTIKFDLQQEFPLLTTRKIFYKGVFGELAAMLKGPKHIEDFKKYGCNYWDEWAHDDGSINIDYGNKWINWNNYNQLKKLTHNLMYNPTSRRLLVSGWDPSNLHNVDLPCCHYAYQWFVRDEGYLDMLWHQRSTDTMIGLPSDAVFAAAWNIIIANEVNLKPGFVTMTLGDCHIYDQHREGVKELLSRKISAITPTWQLLTVKHTPHTLFEPDWIEIKDYYPKDPIKFELLI